MARFNLDTVNSALELKDQIIVFEFPGNGDFGLITRGPFLLQPLVPACAFQRSVSCGKSAACSQVTRAKDERNDFANGRSNDRFCGCHLGVIVSNVRAVVTLAGQKERGESGCGRGMRWRMECVDLIDRKSVV